MGRGGVILLVILIFSKLKGENNMENTYKKNNFRKFTKLQFFNHVSDSFNDFRSQADMNCNNVISEVPMNYFNTFN